MRIFALLLLTVVSMSAGAAEPRQRVVISDDYTSWLLKGENTGRYGDGEALPRLLAEGWTIGSITSGCSEKARTVYVLNAPTTPPVGGGKR